MTLPALDLEALEVLVGPSAWAYHNNLPPSERVDVEKAYRVRRDVRLVAADVLSTAAAQALRAGAAAASAVAVQQVKIGKIEAKLSGGVSGASQSGDAATWEAQAAALRAEVAGDRRQRQRAGSRALQVEVDF